MATHFLAENSTLQGLLDNGGLASGDTINLNGFELACGTDCVNCPVTITGTGKFEARNGGRIKLNNSFPSTCFIYVDQANPLPESNYEAGLTGNASFEFQLNGNFGLGGGGASLPTATRSGNFWALSASSGSTTTVSFDRDLPLHPGDRIANYVDATHLYLYTVASYDAPTKTATVSSTLSNRTNGKLWTLAAGGVCIQKLSSGATTMFNEPVIAGTLVVSCTANTGHDIRFVGTTSTFVADRVSWFNGASTGNAGGCFIGNGAISRIGQLACALAIVSTYTASGGVSNVSAEIGELAAFRWIFPYTNWIQGPVSVGRGFVNDMSSSTTVEGRAMAEFSNATMPTVFPVLGKCFRIRYKDCIVGGNPTGDATYEASGVVIRTSRTDFPTDTDLPDAQYHAPNEAGAVTWRYEDRWVRKGETLRMRARWMPAGASSMASVAVTELETWWPDLWPIGAEALAKAEFAAGLEQLKWYDGSLEWRNDTGEDCQVRVWECVSGDTLGGYLRLWEATGGAM